MNWTSCNSVSYNGNEYRLKDTEFMCLIDRPTRVPNTTLELTVNTGKTRRTPRDLLVCNGWRVVHPDEVCPSLVSYRDCRTRPNGALRRTAIW
jgi:hypothetical protein